MAAYTMACAREVVSVTCERLVRSVDELLELGKARKGLRESEKDELKALRAYALRSAVSFKQTEAPAPKKAPARFEQMEFPEVSK